MDRLGFRFVLNPLLHGLFPVTSDFGSASWLIYLPEILVHVLSQVPGIVHGYVLSK